MKKSILILLCSISMSAQPYIQGTFDVRNLATGSEPTNGNSALNYQLKAGLISYNTKAKIRVGVLYERFEYIDFMRYGLEIGFSQPITKRIVCEPTIILSQIERKTLLKSSVSIGVGLDTIYYLTDNIGIVLTTEYITRPDNSTCTFSNYLGFRYKFNEYSK